MGDGNLYLYNICQEILKVIKGNLTKVLPELWAAHSVVLKFYFSVEMYHIYGQVYRSEWA